MPGGQPFYKMSGSGNDFVFFDARKSDHGEWVAPGVICALCDRGTGIWADGVVLLENSPGADVAIRYYNSDGSLASLCGNASLCATRLATVLGAASPAGFTLATGSGILQARIRDGLPEIDLAPVTEVRETVEGVPPEAGESHLGFALAGVPHAVIACADVRTADVSSRGAALRHDPAFAEGANVNFVARQPGADHWLLRTYERGVESETLACGTGAVSTAILLQAWGLAGDSVVLETRSGKPLEVTCRREGGRIYPSLRGEGRIVFTGVTADLGV